MKEMLVQLGKRAKDAEAALRTISTDKKNQVLAGKVGNNFYEGCGVKTIGRSSG